METKDAGNHLEIELCEDIDEYLICESCVSNFGPTIIKKDEFKLHKDKLHLCTEIELKSNSLSSGKDCENSLHKFYNLNQVVKLRRETDVEEQRRYYDENGKDVSLLEVTETLKTAIKLFLNAYKRKVTYLNYPDIDVYELTEEQLDKLLVKSQGVYYYFSLINLCNIKDITVQTLIARSWDWCEEDQDLRKDFDFIKRNLLNDSGNPNSNEASKCVSVGYLVLLTMTDALKHLLLLLYLTKTVLKRQD